MEGRKDDGSITISLRNFVGEGIINLKSDIFDAVKTFIEVNTISTKINSLCENFSKMCQELIDKHVPSKMTSIRYSQALMNTEIKRLSMKKQKV